MDSSALQAEKDAQVGAGPPRLLGSTVEAFSILWAAEEIVKDASLIG